MAVLFCEACHELAMGAAETAKKHIGCADATEEAKLQREIADLRADAAWLEENGEPFESKKRFEQAAKLQRRLDDLRNDNTGRRWY